MKLKTALGLALIAAPALAQQPQQERPLPVLLNEANTRVYVLSSQLNAANERAQKAEARVKELETATRAGAVIMEASIHGNALICLQQQQQDAAPVNPAKIRVEDQSSQMEPNR